MPPLGANVRDIGNLEPHVERRKGRKIFDTQCEEPRGGMQSAPIGRVVRAGMLFFQMNERPCDLDEAFKIKIVCVAAL
jgi:hypothetical protein